MCVSVHIHVYVNIYRFAFFPLYGILSKKEPDQQMIQPVVPDGRSTNEFALKKLYTFT